jgi:acyl phosphate:glycerol-3-phosphate acyltransferase
MIARGLLWMAAGYLAGAIPSAALVARARGASPVLARARRDSGERDAHILLSVHLGGRWVAVAATADVLKGLLLALAAREWGGLSPAWLAAVGIAVVVGYCWPPLERRMAGRGLAGAAGVYLALLPIPMIVMGVLILLGAALGDTAPASTLGFVVVPVVAAGFGEPPALVAMAAAVALLVFVRRLEGVHRVVAAGIPWPRAALYRVVFDSSGPPDARVIPEEVRPAGPLPEAEGP